MKTTSFLRISLLCTALGALPAAAEAQLSGDILGLLDLDVGGVKLVGSDAADGLTVKATKSAPLPFDGGDGPDFDGGDGPDFVKPHKGGFEPMNITPIGPGPTDALVGSDAADSFDGGDGPDYLQPVGPGPTDALVGSDAADSLVGSDAADSFDGGDGSDFVYELIELAIKSAGGMPLQLQDLFALPGVFDALHAKGPAADELRGYVDWLMMTGIILGGGGGDIMLGGPGSDWNSFVEEGPAPSGEFTSVQAPFDLKKEVEKELGLWVEKGPR